VLSAEVDLAGNLARVGDAIADAAQRAGRRPEEITLVGVSKTQPAELVAKAVRAGLRHVGENRVQEAATKFPLVRDLLAGNPALSTQHSALTFHMVGHLQSNKAAAAVGLFDRVDSVDSLKLAQALSRQLDGASELPVLIEVYVGDDPARPGARPDGLVDLVGQCLEVPGLHVEGLMTIAPLGGDARAAFARVRELKESLSQRFPRVHFGVLSMGMSDDYVEAIQEGSTEVRIGTALFGPRKPRF
jgi:pyridoxal phosphate enzyme (YggS family)